MDRDLDPNDTSSGTPDDATLGALVRSVADDWRQPPQRLGQLSWRERVEATGPGGRGQTGGRGWFGRLAAAGTLAVVATIVLAMGAIYLTGLGRDQGTTGTVPSASPSDGASPRVTPNATTPAVVLDGAPPSVTSVLLQGSGGFRYADLLTGTLQPDLPFGDGHVGGVFPRPGGGWVCVCLTYRGAGGGSPAHLDIELRAVDAAGDDAGVAPVRTVTAEVTTASDSMQVDAQAVASADGRHAYVGWTHRTTTGWRAGIEQVDLATLRIIDSISLSDVDHGDVAAGGAWTRLAPRVSTRPDGNAFLVSSDWYVEDATTSAPPYGTDRWEGYYTPISIPAPDDSCQGWDGLIDDASYYVACIDDGGETHVSRIRLDGVVIDTTDVGRWTGFGVNSDRLGSKLFLWDPQATRLVRFDLVTGLSDTVVASKTGATDGPADVVAALGHAIGDWLAPTAAAKILLQPAIAISPDGTTLYALGIDGSVESFGSTGVFAFDISGDTMSVKGRWDPTADFVSVAVSADGAFVYAAGVAGVDAKGIPDPAIGPSVTVFDASDGSVRLTTQLSGNELLFVEPVVR